MRAGMRNSPIDWRIPTNEYASPVQMTIGNIMRVSETASAAVSGASAGASTLTSGDAPSTPSSVTAPLRQKIMLT